MMDKEMLERIVAEDKYVSETPEFRDIGYIIAEAVEEYLSDNDYQKLRGWEAAEYILQQLTREDYAIIKLTPLQPIKD